MAQSRYVHAIYCDDIRYEMSGKHLLIGCYTNELLVYEFPFTQNKLCVYFTVSTPKTKPFGKLIKISAFKDGELIVSIETKAVDGKDQLEPTVLREGSDSVVMQGVMELPNISFTEPCKLSIKAEFDSDAPIEGPSLWVNTIDAFNALQSSSVAQ